MGLISLLWGIVAMLWMVLALIPLLGWGNWFLIPFAAVGAIIAATESGRANHASPASPLSDSRW